MILGRLPSVATRHGIANDLVAALGNIRDDAFKLYSKTKGLHWHISAPGFREYHFLLEMQAHQLVSMTETIAKRMQTLARPPVRLKVYSDLVRSPLDESADFIDLEDFAADLRVDNQILTGSLRSIQGLCEKCGDIVTGCLIDVWIDEARRRAWVLFEVLRRD